jgi:hypothetical protein
LSKQHFKHSQRRHVGTFQYGKKARKEVMECPTRQKAEFQENSAIPQPIETAIVTHGVKNHKHLGTAIPLSASLLINLRKKLWNVEDQPEKCRTEGQQSHMQSVTDIVYIKRGHCQYTTSYNF